ncbi:MAG TPA: hypothetical protein VMK65_05165 [Longimicrobiales bacterium]|nr:hypothetical protein [Longimicrobiales bacterium]
MRRFAFGTLLLLTGCASLPFGGPSSEERKARCDRMAAQAIETEDLEQAKTLAAQAADCYAQAQRAD